MRRKKEIEIQNLAYDTAIEMSRRLKREIIDGYVFGMSPGEYPTGPHLKGQEVRIMDLEVKVNLILEHLGLKIVNVEAKTILSPK